MLCRSLWEIALYERFDRLLSVDDNLTSALDGLTCRMALVGAGYWGSKLARNIDDCPQASLTLICDPDAQRRTELANRYRSQSTSDLNAVLSHAEIDAVVLATPTSLHAEQAQAALQAGKHVFVEKPMTLDSSSSQRLVALAEQKRLVLMSGHTFMYSEPVIELRKMVRRGDIGQVLYAYGQRLSLGAFRNDMNAFWDLGPHDLSILLYVLPGRPVAVQSHQLSLLDDPQEDVGFTLVYFDDGVVAHIHNSRLDPRKVRQMTFVGDKQMVVYDDTETESPLRVYDRGAVALRETGVAPPATSLAEWRFQTRTGDIVSPMIQGGEPLQREIKHFAECCLTESPPLTDGAFGLAVVALLEAASASAREDGRLIQLEDR